MKYVWLILLIVVVLVFWPKIQTLREKFNLYSPSPTPQALPIELELEQKKFNAYIQKISKSDQLSLIPNFTQKKSTQVIMVENNCDYGVNGGFYTRAAQPLGLFFTNGIYVNQQVNAEKLFNGFVYGNSNGLFGISDSEPHFRENSLDFYFQTGPFFTPEDTLHIKDDELARRALIGKTDGGVFYFIAITDKENVNSGPYLADLPQIVQRLNQSNLIANNHSLITLLNLDGGSASAFYSTDGVAIGEIVPVGSFLCGKT